MSALKDSPFNPKFWVKFLILAVLVLALITGVVAIRRNRISKSSAAAEPCTTADVYKCVNSYYSSKCLSSSWVYRCYGGIWQIEYSCTKGCHYEKETAVCNRNCSEGESYCAPMLGDWVQTCKNDQYTMEYCSSQPGGYCQSNGACYASCKTRVNPTSKPNPTSPPASYTCGSKAYAYCSSGTCPKGQTCKKNDTKKTCNCK